MSSSLTRKFFVPRPDLLAFADLPIISWWNPAAEWQSADRCHRIGQTRPCTITRLCIEDSVESRMVLIQEKKTNMINSTVNSDEKAMESLSPEDMQFLFRGS